MVYVVGRAHTTEAVVESSVEQAAASSEPSRREYVLTSRHVYNENRRTRCDQVVREIEWVSECVGAGVGVRTAYIMLK